MKSALISHIVNLLSSSVKELEDSFDQTGEISAIIKSIHHFIETCNSSSFNEENFFSEFEGLFSFDHPCMEPILSQLDEIVNVLTDQLISNDEKLKIKEREIRSTANKLLTDILSITNLEVKFVGIKDIYEHYAKFYSVMQHKIVCSVFANTPYVEEINALVMPHLPPKEPVINWEEIYNNIRSIDDMMAYLQSRKSQSERINFALSFTGDWKSVVKNQNELTRFLECFEDPHFIQRIKFSLSHLGTSVSRLGLHGANREMANQVDKNKDNTQGFHQIYPSQKRNFS